jgi:uncharacterized repeat protein (TIGR01451 family)
MTTLDNQTFLDLELCGDAVTIDSNEVVTEILDIKITKSASCPYTVIGGTICYTVVIENNSDVELVDVVFRDPLAPGLTYATGSFKVNGASEVPEYDNNILSYILTLPPNSTITIEFCVHVGEQKAQDSYN